jgi:hypothetical protein
VGTGNQGGGFERGRKAVPPYSGSTAKWDLDSMCQALGLHILRALFFAPLLTSHVHGRVQTRLRCRQKSINDAIGLRHKCISSLARSASCRGLRLMFDTRHQNRPSCSIYDDTKPTLSKPPLEQYPVRRPCCIEQRSMLHMALLVVQV